MNPPTMKATPAKTTPIKAVPVSPSPGPRRRHFDATFKREAVAHWQASGLGAGMKGMIRIQAGDEDIDVQQGEPVRGFPIP